MNNGKLHKFLMVTMSLLLVLNFLNTLSIKRRLNDIESGMSRSARDYRSQINDLDKMTRDGFNEINESIEKSSSLFFDKNVDVKLQNNDLSIYVSCSPKKIRNGQILFAEVSTENDFFRQEMLFDSNSKSYSALIKTPVSKKITTNIVIKSSDYNLHESLGSQNIDSFLSMDIDSSWGIDEYNHGAENVLTVIIDEYNKYMPFSKEDVKNAYFLISDDDDFALNNLQKNEISDMIKNSDAENFSLITAEKNIYKHASPTWLLARVDLSDFTNKKDGIEYQAYMIIETKDDEYYVTKNNSICSFSSKDNSASKGSGSNTLSPVFE
ncbi:MAG: hypothetical protein N4A76_14850 [Firmicutes bacterium]|jgi:hypothetical protein|nr:hypothetical protein [Bacillota bacterium]